MYEFFKGQVEDKGPTHLVLVAAGVGYRFAIPLSTAEVLPRTGEARVWAHLHVREDAMKLFGFATLPERQLFLLLQKVAGIGPTLALAILSRAKVAKLCQAIGEGRVDFLKSLKGVGPKTAQRLITELKDKVGAVSLAATELGQPLPASGPADDAIAALEVLGCASKDASKAVDKVLSQEPEIEIEVLVRKSLRLVWPT